MASKENPTSDAVVIGGGVVGLSVALRLRQAGVGVIVVERGQCGREASWAGAGIVAAPNPHRSDPTFLIHRASMERYPAFCAELRELSGIDTEYEPCGALFMLDTDQSVRMAKSDERAATDERASDGGAVLRVIDRADALTLEPHATGECLAYTSCRRTAQVRNPRLLQALRVACERLGVCFREHTPVRGVIRKGERVVGVRCEDAALHVDHVVLCAGAWSSQWQDEQLAAMVPVDPVRGQIVLVHTGERLIRRIVQKRHVYLVPRRDGHLLIGATVERDSGFDKRNTPAGVNGLITEAVSMVPALADAAVVGMWAGLRPCPPDHRPYIGAVPGWENLIAATGHCRSGLTLAAITADIVCELVTGGASIFDLSRCRPGRALQRA